MFMELLLIIISLWIMVILFWYLNQYRYYKYLRSIPGPTPLPIVGNSFELSSPSDALPKLMEWKKKYGGIYRMFVGFRPIILVVSEHKFLEFLLGTTVFLKKSHAYRYAESWLGTGLLTSTGSKWKKHRKIITPAFHFKILEHFVDVFEKNGSILVEILRQEINSKSFDVYPYITNTTLDVICETALGTEINAQKESDSEYVRSVKEMCRVIMDRSLNPFYHFNTIFKLSSLYRKQQRALKILHGTTKSVIQNRKKQRGNNISSKEDLGIGIKNKLVFLDLLLQSTTNEQSLTDEELREEVDTFMFAGHDTTAAAISFVLYNLSIYPEIQRKAVEELKSIFADDVYQPCTYSDLQAMRYLEVIIKETLRLFPPVPLIGRTADKNFKYEEMEIPAGTHIIVLGYGIMRDPKYFSDPETFNPDRFLNDNANLNLNPYAYIPFSAGPRNCLGQKYAMLEMKSIIAKILKYYEIVPAKPSNGLELSAQITLKAINGVNIGIKERKW